MVVEKYAGEYGPHSMQEGLMPLYEKVAEAEKNALSKFKIKDIYCFYDQKHGMEPKEAISFGIVLDSGPIIKRAGVMGGISTGKAEPCTHGSIEEAIDFFYNTIRQEFIGLNVSQAEAITKKIIDLDDRFRNCSTDQSKPRFSYIGSEISVGISMICSIAFAERLGVPLEIVLNYRYNKYCITNRLANEIRPITIPINYSVVWEGGKHGAAFTLEEMENKKIITDPSKFPPRFKDIDKVKARKDEILLAMVPPQELQFMIFTCTWEQARNIGIRLTEIYKEKLKERGIHVAFGVESGFTTKQTHTSNCEPITLELILDILSEATDALGDDSKFVRWALDLASSEMYVSEIDMYYVGPKSAKNGSGLVTNEEFTRYKLELFNKYPRFISVEDWADESKMEHWEDAKKVMPYMIQLGDDNVVSNAKLIEKFKDVQNAHLQKPNQSAEEQAMIAAVGTSHKLGNVVVFSHRGTRPADEDYTATAAMAMSAFGGKWTLWGIGRGALITAMNQVDKLYHQGPYAKVEVPYQGELILDPNSPYQQGWAKRLRAGFNEVDFGYECHKKSSDKDGMSFSLKKLPNPIDRPGPVIVIVMDGIGIGKHDEGDAVFLANTPTLDSITKKYLNTKLMAHGTYVGLPSNDDMGNSEVGHNAIGAGRVYDQGAILVNKAIASGTLFEGTTWKKLIKNCKDNNSALHFIGLLSDGNVHSHINHLKSMIAHAAEDGIKNVYIHALLDGRDVHEKSAHIYINKIESFLSSFNAGDRKYKIASGGGRMKITMDRNEAEWSMVELGWKTHVEGEGRYFKSALNALETLRQETGVTDQYISPFVIAEDGKPVAKINDGDSVIFFNFRSDRAIEISKAFENKNLPHIKREHFPKVEYAGMMLYDWDQKIPKKYLVEPPFIQRTMGEYLAKNDISQFAISETQKYSHVTLFWNGNRSGKFDEKYEYYFKIPSDIIPFDQRPWMKSAEIATEVIELLRSKKYKHGRINFPNGDMVGHTGFIDATRIAVECVDLALGRILEVIDEIGGIALVTADHGNSDQMYEYDKEGNIQMDQKTGKKVKRTSHSLNQVPFIIYDPSFNGEYRLIRRWFRKPGLSNIAATVFNLLGYYAPDGYDASLISINSAKRRLSARFRHLRRFVRHKIFP